MNELTEGAVVEGASALPDAPSGDAAPAATERAPRGRGRERGERGERQERGERTEAGEPAMRSDDRQDERPTEREPRNGRERSVYASRDPGFAAPSDAAPASTAEFVASEADARPPATERTERPARGEDAGGRRRERRPEGGGVRDERPAPSMTAGDQEGSSPVPSSTGDEDAGALQAVDAAGTGTGEAPSRRDGDERRGRSRDRYGRDRRERGPRDEAAAAPMQQRTAEDVDREVEAQPLQRPVKAPEAEVFASVPEKAHSSIASPAVPEPAEDHLVSMGNSSEAVPASTSASVDGQAGDSHGLPRVRPFELPVAALTQVAEGSGLQWVNSNAERIAQVQAAIAAEPAAIHVPRERPPVVVVDEGPLVLVETKRDLAKTVLPFERSERVEEAGTR